MKPVPIGPGLTVRRVRLAERDVVLLGGLLHGEDHLASIHGDGRAEGSRVTVALLTTDSRAAELDAWLEDLADALDLELA